MRRRIRQLALSGLQQRLIDEEREDARSLGAQVGLPSKFRDEGIPVASSHSTTWVASVPLAIPRPVLGAAGELVIYRDRKCREVFGRVFPSQKGGACPRQVIIPRVYFFT